MFRRPHNAEIVQVHVLEEVFTDNVPEEVGAAVYLLVGVAQRAADTLIFAVDADGVAAYRVVAKGVKAGFLGIKPPEQLLPVALGKLVFDTFKGNLSHVSPPCISLVSYYSGCRTFY